MPKLRRALSAFLALWLCVMLIAFTYTWVSRNWTPSIKSDDINIASSGALVISILSDTSAVHTEVSLNDVVGLEVNNAFTFKQVSSQDGVFSVIATAGQYTSSGRISLPQSAEISLRYSIRLMMPISIRRTTSIPDSA